MREEDFITSDKDKAYIENVGLDFLDIVDIETEEKFRIPIEKAFAEGFKEEMKVGDTIFVLYDKETNTLV